MAEYKRGIKAGVSSQIIANILGSIVLTPIVYYFSYSGVLIMDMYSSTYGGFLYSSFVYAILVGIFYGVIYGLIYAAYYSKLFGDTSIKKGLFLSFCGWILFGLLYGLILLSFASYFLLSVITSLIQHMLFGALLGFFWDKFKGKPVLLTTKSFEQYSDEITKPAEPKKPQYTKETLTEGLHKFIEKYPSLKIYDTEQMIQENTYYSLQRARSSLYKMADKLKSYEELLSTYEANRKQRYHLTERLADVKIDGDTFHLAMSNLETAQKEIEEKLWSLRNELFKEDYEKPF
jgi:hypothetical protein